MINSTRVRIEKTYVRRIGLRRQKIRQIGRRSQHRRRQQADRELAKAFDLGKKDATSRLGKMLIDDAIDYIPTAYKNIKNKIRNTEVKSVLCK